MPTLRLLPRDRLVSDSAQSPRRFLDFEVDGQSLFDTLRGRGFEVIGAIWLEPPFDESRLRLIGRLPADLPPDRVAVFVCPECADLGCGAVTVRLELRDDVVTWTDWSWQTDYDPALDRSQLADLPALVFDRAQYEHVIQSLEI